MYIKVFKRPNMVEVQLTTEFVNIHVFYHDRFYPKAIHMFTLFSKHFINTNRMLCTTSTLKHIFLKNKVGYIFLFASTVKSGKPVNSNRIDFTHIQV